MGKLFAINIIGVLFLSYMHFWFIDYSRDAEEESANIHLSAAIDHSGKAALYTLLGTRDVSLDYENLNDVQGDPQETMDMFVDVLLMNLGMSLSEENRHYVRTAYMPTFVVALTDGYHIARQEKVKGGAYGEYDLVLSPKLGYTYKFNNQTYGLLQGSAYHYHLTGVHDVTGGKEVLRKGGRPPGLSTTKAVHEQIGKIIAGAMSEVIEGYHEDSSGNWSADFYLPSELTTHSKVNAIEGPTVITILQGVDVNTVEPIDTFSVTGSKVQFNRTVLGYRDATGKKYYSYADTIPTNKWGNGLTLEEPFNNIHAAARAGYIADIKYLQITR